MNEAASLDACAEITRREARNFYYGLRLLPPAKRRALYAVYAWMRVLDDLADDDAREAAAKSADLARFEEATRAVLAGGSADGRDARESAVLAGLRAVIAGFPVDPADFEGAIEGQLMDLAPRGYAAFADTERYCDRVAATVGRICLDVWGARDGTDPEIARELSTRRGIAFQLVNILRDIREDHERGRCYLPSDELAASGLSIESLIAWTDGARCARFMHVQVSRAERIFAESTALDGMVSADAVPTIRAMSAIYRGILRKIARDPRRALAERARLSAIEKSWIALRARFGLLGAIP